MLNTVVNWISLKLGYSRFSFSKKIKNSVKGAIKFINDFEITAAEIAINEGYDYVVCGHIHQPEIKKIKTDKGETTYLNSGDWIENLSALEYNNKEWNLYEYEKDTSMKKPKEIEVNEMSIIEASEQSNSELFEELLVEFNIKKFSK